MGIPEEMKSGLGHNSTILAFRLENWQLEMLKEVIKVKDIKGRLFNIYITDVFTDLFAIPYFIAFINFESVAETDKQSFWAYWRECREPLSDDVLTELNTNSKHPVEKYTKMPLTYVLNCDETDILGGNYLFLNRDIFSNKERLRLMIMQEIKNIEGKGRQANDKASEKLRRVLYMYNKLVYEGWINKDKVDKWLDFKGHKQISQRTFMRDMEIIKDFDRNVEYNTDTKRYEINIETYFLRNKRLNEQKIR